MPRSSLAPGNFTLRDSDAFGRKMVSFGKKWFGIEKKIKSFIPKLEVPKFFKKSVKQEKEKNAGQEIYAASKKRQKMMKELDF